LRRQGRIDADTFDRSAASFNNPDHVDIVIHNYRWRLGLADGEAEYGELEKRLSSGPHVSVPTITLEGDATARPTHTRAPTPRSSRAGTRTETLTAGSATTCPGKRPRLSPTP
jgi:hypothetical protein